MKGLNLNTYCQQVPDADKCPHRFTFSHSFEQPCDCLPPLKTPNHFRNLGTVLAPTEAQTVSIAGRYIFNMWLGSFFLMISQSLMAPAPALRWSLSVALPLHRVDSADCDDSNCRLVWDVGFYLPRNIICVKKAGRNFDCRKFYAQLCPN